MSNPLFKKKPMDTLLREAAETGEHTLKRTLGPLSLTALGVGAVIGAGIFVMAGLGAHYAGPGLMLSFVLSGLGCAFAGLCYAEFAAMIPLAGSAYTYAYATLGEIFAWIIGWDLTLEYAMGASTVSSGWSNHFIELLQYFPPQDAALAGLRPLDRAAQRQKTSSPARWHAVRSVLWRRHAGVPQRVGAHHGRAIAGAAAARARPARRAAHLRLRDRLQPPGLPHRPGHHRHPGRSASRKAPTSTPRSSSSRSRWCCS